MAELLAPAGNFEKLKWAIAYGADAVYFGVKDFSLRSFAGNFSFEEAENGLKLLHSKGKQGFVTLNIYPFSEEYPNLIKTAKILEDIHADALIVSDLGVIFELKKAGIKTPIHISTQANTLSWQTIMAYKELGAKRVNLARELSFERIKEIQKGLQGAVETEVFIHGAVCFSYSGRCAISDYMTGRRANRGECTHPCRWKYHLVEETRPGVFMPVAEDERGLYFFNPKELALFPYMPDLKELGVTSFKIEGRMKSIYYIASVLSLYRKILDGELISEKDGLEILSRVNNRGYSHGFMKGNLTPDDYGIETHTSNSEAVFLGNIMEEKEGNFTLLEVRNKILSGEKVEVMTPDGKITEMLMPEILYKKDKEAGTFANHTEIVLLQTDFPPFTIFRRV